MKWLFWRFLYRPLMRFAHRHAWHHAPILGPLEDGRMQRWCQWCGFRQSFMPEPVTKWCCKGIGGHDRTCRHHPSNCNQAADAPITPGGAQ